MHGRWLAIVVTIIAVSVPATSQDRAVSPEPAFEVASIRVNPNDDVPEGISLQPDGVRFTAFRVRTLISIAYRSEGLQRFDQIIGGPSWLAVDRFDVVAKTGGEPVAQGGPPTELSAMLRTLLRDRFRLRVHRETRSMPAFALVVARRDRRLGRQLRESTLDCPPAGVAATDADPDRWCGIRATGGVIVGRAVSAAQFAGNLSGYSEVDRFVTDRTGLTGRYDFRLEYTPASLRPSDVFSNPGPSLFTALTEQLGLTLQPEMAVLPVLVIDNIERPVSE